MNKPVIARPAVRAALLAWYEAHARDLPWRVGPRRRAAGETPNPYRVWLSEVMLQQTTAAAVAPYFEAFVRRWPTLEALAASPIEDVLAAWAGLGYYARARNLHAAARTAAAAGGVPRTAEALRALPGVGAYTAAAIAAIAFDEPANAIDGNIERVIARLFAIAEPLPQGRARIEAAAAELVAPRRAGDWIQALMDLGATVCTPRRPVCAECPIAFACRAAADGAPERYPVKPPKPVRPSRHGAAFVLARDGKVLVTTRPPSGLLGGMLALPATPFREAPWSLEEAAQAAFEAPGDRAAAWRPAGALRHVFTHFSLRLEVFHAPADHAAAGQWLRADDAGLAALPTVFRKAAVLGLSAQP